MSAPYGQDGQIFCPAIYTYQALGNAQLVITATPSTFKTLLTAAVAASPATSSFSDIPTGARLARMTLDAANVRWGDDPSLTISATVGLLMVFSTTVPAEYLYSGDLNAIKFVLASGSPLLNVAFLK